MKLAIIIVFLLLTSGSVAFTWWLNRRKERHHAATLERSVATGLNEPPSLHPVIDPDRCIGTAACVAACPEGGILGIVNGRATLIEPSRCIGHGACHAACPTDAIQLVFGTARRGVEIPHVTPEFETNVPGLYIAGELGGMGLVQNAMSQGIQAVESIARSLRSRNGAGATRYDVAVIGAGPAGLAASLAARRAGLRAVTLEQEAIGGTVYHYPREKMVVTRPIDLPGYGRIQAREIRKEALLALWEDVIRTTGIEIRTDERMTAMEPRDGGFVVETSRGRYEAARVVLAVGRRGSPRKLGVPGEESPHVAYSLGDPADTRGKAILVVGGGNSALEAAIELASPSLANRVTLSYRGRAFGRATPANRDRLEDLERGGRIRILPGSEVSRIGECEAELRLDGGPTVVAADQIFIMIGGELPTGLLRRLGVEIDMKLGTA